MMSNIGKLILIGFFLVAVPCLFSCGDDAPTVAQPQVVKKKIGDSGSQPKAAIEDKTAQPEKAENGKSAAAEQEDDKDAIKSASKLVKESMAFSGVYNAKGRFDPFEPLFKDEGEQVVKRKGRRKKGPGTTPLERIALSQLKLTAIMRMTRGNNAVVEDATGKGYVIRKGTYIGLNSGQVIQIDKNRVLIEEEIEDSSGEFQIQNTELKLQKPAGEL